MSIVLSYRAFRAEPLSEDEAAAIDIVIARYQSDFEYRDAADAFTVYSYDPSTPEIIFSGTINLPEHDTESYTYWTCCLTDICRILEDATWYVSLGDVLLGWDEDDGWLLPET